MLRANVGDEIRINFYNRLNRRASLQMQRLEYDVLPSDGASIGCNPDTTAGGFIQYTWYATKEGGFLFSDMADTRSGELGTNVHGLFGAIIVEKAGSAWFHPVTGEALKSGLFADIYHPSAPAFREYAVFFHDELEIASKDGEPPIDPHTGPPGGTTAISDRSEPIRSSTAICIPISMRACGRCGASLTGFRTAAASTRTVRPSKNSNPWETAHCHPCG